MGIIFEQEIISEYLKYCYFLLKYFKTITLLFLLEERYLLLLAKY